MSVQTIQEIIQNKNLKPNGINENNKKIEIETVTIDSKQDLINKWNNYSVYSINKKGRSIRIRIETYFFRAIAVQFIVIKKEDPLE